MVVGCGALGNEVLKNLALMGVGNIVLVDYDRVEPRNLHRSVLFSEIENSIGQLKVDCAAKAILKINPETNLTLIDGDIAADVGLKLISEMDIVIGCVDNRWARYAINRLCMRAGIPWIDGGITELEGTVKMFEPGKNCYACSLTNEDINELKRHFSCAGNIRRALKTASAPTTSLIASIIGAVQVQEAIKFIHNKYGGNYKFKTLSGKMFYYDGKHMTSGVVSFRAYDEICSHHEKWSPIMNMDISNEMTIEEILKNLEIRLGKEVEIELINDRFVESIIDKETDEEFTVKLPARKVEKFIERNSRLNKKTTGSYYQKEINKISLSTFSIKLTLKDLGIPSHDVLKVRDLEGQEYFIGIV